ncbi:MAG: hypothetical protein Q9226_008808, partial [Calogaya cf. arnoldii]
MSLTPNEVVKTLILLTNLSENHARLLVATAVRETWIYADLESLIDDAEEARKITPEVAAIGKMAFMTHLPVDRCRNLINETKDAATDKLDLYRAITRAQLVLDIAPKIGRPARLAALMSVDLATAKQFLEEANDRIQRAIPHMREGLPCAPAVADIAMSRYLTNFTESQTTRYLARAGEGGIEKAIRLAGDDGIFQSAYHCVTALLRVRFDLDRSEAEMYASKATIHTSRTEDNQAIAIQLVLTDRFMKETMLDREDARVLMERARGDLELARELYLQELTKEPLIEAKNGDTRHPPDVQYNTHVIAVCGVADDATFSASPAKDGWMISDFYLWKHVLEGLGESQQWITREDPRDLVEKYGSIDQTITTTSSSGLASATQTSWADG